MFSLQTHCTLNPSFYLVNIRLWVTAVVLEVGSALNCSITLWLALNRYFFPHRDDWCSASPGARSERSHICCTQRLLIVQRQSVDCCHQKEKKERWTLDLSAQENIYKACLEGIWESCVRIVAFLSCCKTKLCWIYCDPEQRQFALFLYHQRKWWLVVRQQETQKET